jgi:hypothetical protein
MMLAGANQILKACQSQRPNPGLCCEIPLGFTGKGTLQNLICAHAGNAAAIALDNLIHNMARKTNRLPG